jgi:hypothetical protein
LGDRLPPWELGQLLAGGKQIVEQRDEGLRGVWRRAPVGIPPSGPGGPVSARPASAVTRARTGRAFRGPRGRDAARRGSPGCRLQPSMSCGCGASRGASARP